jgi:hypothetical protein
MFFRKPALIVSTKMEMFWAKKDWKKVYEIQCILYFNLLGLLIYAILVNTESNHQPL